MTKRVEKKLSAGAALTGLVGVVACLAVSGSPALAGDDAPAAGMKVYVDPATGQLIQAPPQQAPTGALSLSPAEQRAFSTSSQGLVETPSSVPGGGYKLDLQGRFQSAIMATVGPDGKPQLKHVGGAPAELAK